MKDSLSVRLNKHNQMILNEQDLVSAWLEDKTVTSGTFENNQVINRYNTLCDIFEIGDKISTIDEFKDESYVENWFMPEEYKTLDIEKFLLDKVGNTTSKEWNRCVDELEMFKQRGMYPVLQFLVYFVKICRDNNIVLGVGRGSSVASYVLYLIGIHKINSLKYDLDIKEFLK